MRAILALLARAATRFDVGAGHVRWCALLFVSWLALAVPQVARADQEACLAAHEQAQLMRMRSRYLEARQQLIACAQAACPSEVRADCKVWLQEVESSLPSVVFAIADEAGHDLVEARVSNQDGLVSERADGRAIVLNPGAHILRVEAPGFAPSEQQLSVREGEKRRLVRVTLSRLPGQTGARGVDPPARSAAELRAQRLLRTSYVLGGLGVVSLGTGIALGVIGERDRKRLEDAGCEPDCDKAEVDAGRRKFVLADVAFGAAGAFLGAAVFTFVWGFRQQRARERPPSIGVALDPRGMSLSWQRRF